MDIPPRQPEHPGKTPSPFQGLLRIMAQEMERDEDQDRTQQLLNMGIQVEPEQPHTMEARSLTLLATETPDLGTPDLASSAMFPSLHDIQG